MGSRLAGRLHVHCHSRMILPIWFSDKMRYIWVAAIRRLISLCELLFPDACDGKRGSEKKFLKVGVNQPLYHCNRPNSFLIKYCQQTAQSFSTARKAGQVRLLLLRILRREIGYNFLETWVAAQRIPVRVQFQVTIA